MIAGIRYALAAVVSLVGITSTHRAHACAARGDCQLGATAPTRDATIPSSAPGLAFNPGWRDPRQLVWNNILSFELLDAADQLVEGTIEGDSRPDLPAAFILTTALTARSTYKIRVSGGCAAADQMRETIFKTGDAAPLPTVLGNVTVTATSTIHKLDETPFNPGCWQLVPTSGVVLDIAPSDALRPFLPVARFTTKVDGAIWARSDYGSTKFAQAADYNGYGVPGFAPRIDDIELSCTPARHKLSISVEIAGATENPPAVELDVEVPCVTVGAEPRHDAGAPSIDGPGDAIATDAAPGADAGPPSINATGGAIVVDSSPTNDSANAPATDPSAVETHLQLGHPQVQSEGGCSIARNAGAGLWPAVSLLAGVASLQRTRRRKRRRQLPSTGRSTWILVVGVGASIGAGCAADSAHVGPSENVVDEGNDASTDVVATDEAEADQLDEAEADQLDASLCDGGRWVYLQAGCGPSTPPPTCWVGLSEACATLFCWCDKTSSFGGCGPGSERPFASVGACRDGESSSDASPD